MKSIEEYIHDRLKELQGKKESLRKELESIEVRVEELNNIILKIANEPADMDDDKIDEDDYMEVDQEPIPVLQPKKKVEKIIEESEEDPMEAAMKALAEEGQDMSMMDEELGMLADDIPPLTPKGK